MNDQIQELADHATEDIMGVKILNKKKFAELIVRECARIANEKEEGFPQYEPDMSVHYYITKHFGFDNE